MDQDAAHIQSDLGAVFRESAKFSEKPNEEINLAIKLQLDALKVLKEEEMPQDFAATQVSLGKTYLYAAKISDTLKKK